MYHNARPIRYWVFSYLISTNQLNLNFFSAFKEVLFGANSDVIFSYVSPPSFIDYKLLVELDISLLFLDLTISFFPSEDFP